MEGGLRFAQRRRTGARPSRLARRWPGPQRGVSDVVATILILAITVTLFASLFAFVDSFPPPPAQSVNEFRATLQYTANNSYIQSLSILMTAGPVVTPSDSVYMKSAANPALPAFNTAIPVAWGINNATVWTVGQSWVYTFGATHQPKLPDNITVFLVSTTQLLYSTTIPGSVPNLPPSVVAAGITPTNPAVAAAFQIYAQFTGNLTGGTPTVNIAGIPGLAGTQTMVKYSGEYVWNVTASSTTTVGSYDAWLSVTNGAGQTATAEIPITITSGSTGGSVPFTVTVGLSPLPQSILPQQGTLAYTLWAAIAYSGSKSNVPVYVNFTVTQLAGGRSTSLSGPGTTIGGQSSITVSGPATVTVYSNASGFISWLLNSTVKITATATLGQSVGTGTGSISFVTQNLVTGIVYVTTSSAGAIGNVVPKSPATGFSHTCTAATCPYLYLDVWDNYTTALGGPATVTFSGVEYANATGHSFTFTIASTSVTQGGSMLLDPAGATTRWTQVTAAGTYTVSIWLTIKSSASGTPTIGYIYDTFPLTVS